MPEQLHSVTIASNRYELLAKLRGATGRDSEDAKAPLKAIRNAIDQAAFHTCAHVSCTVGGVGC